MDIFIKIQYFKCNYKNNKRKGYGNMIFNNGEVYEGNWENDIINGYWKYNIHIMKKKYQY